MDWNVIEKIRKLRKDNNVTQEQLAERLEISRSKVSSWETNRREMSITEAVKIANMFEVSLDNLFDTKNIGKKQFIEVANKFIKNKNIELKEKIIIIELITDSLKKNNLDELYENYIMTQNATKY